MSNVHWVDPNGVEITEFAGFRDDCGPCANEVCLATVQKRKPSTANMNAIRQRDIGAGLFNAGQTVDELVNDLMQFEHMRLGTDIIQTPPHGQTTYDAPDFNLLWKALQTALLRGNSCVLNLGNAQALPGNEKGVQWHFVSCVGIDSSLGYLICNGDEIPFDGQPNWVTWQDLVNAKLVSVVEYVKGAQPVTQGTVPQGWVDNGTTLTAPNGVPVVHGFRDFILARQWEPTNLPLAPESGDDTHSVQTFLDCELGWTPQYGVFYGGIGKEIVGLRTQYAMLAATNDSLQKQHTTDVLALDKANEQIAALQDEVTKLQQEVADATQASQTAQAALAFVQSPAIAPLIAAAALVAKAGNPLN